MGLMATGTSDDRANITDLLNRWSGGDTAVEEELINTVYNELRRLAGHYLRNEQGITLQATALVHEAYLRLIKQEQVSWQNRAHFFAMAGQMMRRILIDAARMRKAGKRGGSSITIPLDEALEVSEKLDSDIVVIDEALTELAALDARQSRVVELKFFGGLSLDEIALALNISSATVWREWHTAKLWLFQALKRKTY